LTYRCGTKFLVRVQSCSSALLPTLPSGSCRQGATSDSALVLSRGVMEGPRERVPTGGEDLPNVYHEPGTFEGSKLVVSNTFIDLMPNDGESSGKRRFSQPVFSTNSERPEADIEPCGENISSLALPWMNML